MDRFFIWVAYLTASAVAWLAGLHSIFWALLILQGIDVFTGVLVARKTHTFRSAIAKAGIQQRLATWALIGAIGVVQYTTGILPAPPEAGGMGVTEWATLAMAFMEFASIVENSAMLGVSVPSWLLVAVEKTKTVLGLTPREPRDGQK